MLVGSVQKVAQLLQGTRVWAARKSWVLELGGVALIALSNWRPNYTLN